METLLQLGGLNLSLHVAKHLSWFSFTEQDSELLPALCHSHQSNLHSWLGWIAMTVSGSGPDVTPSQQLYYIAVLVPQVYYQFSKINICNTALATSNKNPENVRKTLQSSNVIFNHLQLLAVAQLSKKCLCISDRIFVSCLKAEVCQSGAILVTVLEFEKQCL